ncbi:hypothetical protein RE9425_05060 [Prescottella equi]|nr:hypothetical protein RE9425_05060 [Prescottella equi]
MPHSNPEVFVRQSIAPELIRVIEGPLVAIGHADPYDDENMSIRLTAFGPTTLSPHETIDECCCAAYVPIGRDRGPLR